jgi:hypothetical protein
MSKPLTCKANGKTWTPYDIHKLTGHTMPYVRRKMRFFNAGEITADALLAVKPGAKLSPERELKEKAHPVRQGIYSRQRINFDTTFAHLKSFKQR